MFGYIVINEPELRIREFDLYRSYYCGLCEDLRDDYGRFGQLTLNYDTSFLGLLLTCLYEPEDEKFTKSSCIVHPLSKRPKRRNKYTQYAADVTILLSWYSMRDNWEDEQQIQGLAMSGLLHSAFKKAKGRHPEKAQVISDCLERLHALEKRNTEKTETPGSGTAPGPAASADIAASTGPTASTGIAASANAALANAALADSGALSGAAAPANAASADGCAPSSAAAPANASSADGCAPSVAAAPTTAASADGCAPSVAAAPANASSEAAGAPSGAATLTNAAAHSTAAVLPHTGREVTPDEAGACFGDLMAELFAYEHDMWEQPLRRMGFYLGKFIYLLDAYDDLEDDADSGSFNPLLPVRKRMQESGAGFDDYVRALLTMLMASCTRAFEALPIVENVDILRNILYAGVWTKFEKIYAQRTGAASPDKDEEKPAGTAVSDEKKEP